MTGSNTAQEWEEWFKRVWGHREETVYPSLFGGQSRGIFPVQAEMITDVFKQETLDPRWLHYGVIEFAPTDSRSSWLYVTSGMSNDWEAQQPDPTTPSGLGCEFIFETVKQSHWAILRLLHLTVFQILLCHGRYPDRDALTDFDRVPLRSSIRPEPSVLTYLMLAPPSRFPREVDLESGPFAFYQVVGISDAEAAYAKSKGGQALLELLNSHNYFPVTDPDRREISHHAA
jgi:hypothetical protein